MEEIRDRMLRGERKDRNRNILEEEFDMDSDSTFRKENRKNRPLVINNLKTRNLEKLRKTMSIWINFQRTTKPCIKFTDTFAKEKIESTLITFTFDNTLNPKNF